MSHPATIGPYRVIRQLGVGGMGVVYLVEDPQLKRPLALKLILKRGSHTAYTRFWREAQALAQIKHPGVIKIHKLDQLAEGPYLLEEFVDGEPLSDLIERGVPPFERSAQILRDLADAVHAVHSQGILHRDIKLANVVLRADTGKPMLLDFGLAREVDAETLTKTGQILGTPAYMSPEQAHGKSSKELTPAVDVYALGCSLYTLLTGETPFAAGNMVFLLHMIMTAEPKWPQELNPQVPDGLDTICRVAMAKEPGDRYPTAAAMRDDLDAFLRGEPRRSRTQRSSRRLVQLLLIPLLALAGAVTLWALSTNPSPDRGEDVAAKPPTPVLTESPPTPVAQTPKPLWTLTTGDAFTFMWNYRETDGQRDFFLTARIPTRVVGPVEGDAGRLLLESTFEWITASFGFQQGGMAPAYDTREPHQGHPLENLDVAVGRAFTYQLDLETGHVSSASGVTAIYEAMKEFGFKRVDSAAPILEETPFGEDMLPTNLLTDSTNFFFSRAFHDRLLRQCFDAALHAGGGACDKEVVAWEADGSSRERYLINDRPASPGIYPVSAHFGVGAVTVDSEHRFALRGEIRYQGGRLVTSTLKQELLYPKPGPGLGDTIEIRLSIESE